VRSRRGGQGATYWGELTVELEGAPISKIVPAKPLAMASLIIMGITFGLIQPRMLFERIFPAPA
jgi:hypothetical protein